MKISDCIEKNITKIRKPFWYPSEYIEIEAIGEQHDNIRATLHKATGGVEERVFFSDSGDDWEPLGSTQFPVPALAVECADEIQAVKDYECGNCGAATLSFWKNPKARQRVIDILCRYLGKFQERVGQLESKISEATIAWKNKEKDYEQQIDELVGDTLKLLGVIGKANDYVGKVWEGKATTEDCIRTGEAIQEILPPWLKTPRPSKPWEKENER